MIPYLSHDLHVYNSHMPMTRINIMLGNKILVSLVSDALKWISRVTGSCWEQRELICTVSIHDIQHQSPNEPLSLAWRSSRRCPNCETRIGTCYELVNGFNSILCNPCFGCLKHEHRPIHFPLSLRPRYVT